MATTVQAGALISVRKLEMNELRVKDAMTHLVVTVDPEDKITQAAKRLLSNRISGAPVVQGRRLVGIVSEADFIKALLPSRRRGSFLPPHPLMLLLLRETPSLETRHSVVGDVMTKDVVTIGPDDSIWEAASLIDRHGVRRLPVVDYEGHVVGILARSDLVRCMARTHEEKKAS
jgi:CBS domain-containing protein